MRRILTALAFATLACQGGEQVDTMTGAIDKARQAAGQVTSMGEQTYRLEGRIVGRDPETRQLTVDHKEIPGVMAAMTMPYEVRGAELSALPPDGTEITATAHVKGDTWWLTDVRAK